MFKKLSLAAVALIACAGIGLAAGNFGLWPIVGSLSYCAGTENTPGTCSLTVPAGPSDLVGTATIPVDTNNAQGIQPQTVLLPAVLTGSTIFNASPLTATSVAVPAGTAKVVLTPAGTIATLTLTLPAGSALFDGQELFFYSNNTVTALTVTAGSGTTITPSITTLTAAAPVKLIYVQLTQTTGTWQLF